MKNENAATDGNQNLIKAFEDKCKSFTQKITGTREFVKFVNGGKNGTYLYSAIVKINGTYYWTMSVLCKRIEDKHNIDINSLLLTRELNEYSLKSNNLIN